MTYCANTYQTVVAIYSGMKGPIEHYNPPSTLEISMDPFSRFWGSNIFGTPLISPIPYDLEPKLFHILLALGMN